MIPNGPCQGLDAESAPTPETHERFVAGRQPKLEFLEINAAVNGPPPAGDILPNMR
jgi:hypothetical protein